MYPHQCRKAFASTLRIWMIALVLVGANFIVSTHAIAQKAVLYVEDKSDPYGKKFSGSAQWRMENFTANGQASTTARADVQIPDRNLRMTLALRKNTDRSLPADYLVEIIFTTHSSGKRVVSVPGVLLKEAENKRGSPTRGRSVKVTPNYFLIGLSRAEGDSKRNQQLLSQRDWFDIPIVWEDGGRAILAIEKSDSGRAAINNILQIHHAPSVSSADIKSRLEVPLEKDAGVFVVPVFINNAIILKFVIDSGASDVSIPADVVMTLIRTGTLDKRDFIGSVKYSLADGSTMPSTRFRIRSLKVGNKVVENVIGSVAPVQGSLLLGQSFLSRFKSWSIDNNTHELVLNE